MMSVSYKPYRKSNRLNGYDYTLAGAYFVTIVTYQHLCLFGEVINSEMKLNPSGKIAFDQWMRLSKRFPLSDFSIFVIMPNHVHGILFMKGAGDEPQNNHDQPSTLRPYSSFHVIPGSLGAIVRAYKASVSFRINKMLNLDHPPIWQRNYYDHIIRNEDDFENIWKYIEANPRKWDEDRFHPSYSIKQ
jgi:REP element-mobilizing transposase RayT